MSTGVPSRGVTGFGAVMLTPCNRSSNRRTERVLRFRQRASAERDNQRNEQVQRYTVLHTTTHGRALGDSTTSMAGSPGFIGDCTFCL
jgi:hypothetical protein